MLSVMDPTTCFLAPAATEVGELNNGCSLEYTVGFGDVVEIASPVVDGSVFYPDHLGCNMSIGLHESARSVSAVVGKVCLAIYKNACHFRPSVRPSVRPPSVLPLDGGRTYVFASRRHDRLLRLKFLAFELEGGIGGERKGDDACAFDRLKMSDNGSNRVLCGDWRDDLDRLEYVASSGAVALSFTTDFSGRYPGFKLQVCYV